MEHPVNPDDAKRATRDLQMLSDDARINADRVGAPLAFSILMGAAAAVAVLAFAFDESIFVILISASAIFMILLGVLRPRVTRHAMEPLWTEAGVRGSVVLTVVAVAIGALGVLVSRMMAMPWVIPLSAVIVLIVVSVGGHRAEVAMARGLRERA